MSVFDEQPPIINVSAFSHWLKKNYSLFKSKNIKLSRLNSERDINLLIKGVGIKQYVVKISNPKESLVQLEYQDLLINHLRLNIELRKIYPEILHKKILFYKDRNERRCAVRVLTYIDGNMYAKSKNTDHTEKSLGKLLALQSNQLKSFIKNQAIRKFEWDPSDIRWTKKFINLFKGVNKNIIKQTIDEHEKFVFKNIKNLKHAVTHGDPNDYNIVVKKEKIIGFIDFGDSIYAPVINDLAISLSYALMGTKNFYKSLKNIVGTYNEFYKLSDQDIYSLLGLIKSRLVITLVMAAKQRKKYPDNKYLSISEKNAWDLIYNLHKVDPYFFIAVIRDICNLEPISNFSKKLQLFKNQKFGNLFDFELNNVNKKIVNFDKSSFLLKTNPSNKKLDNLVGKFLKKDIGIGLYKEKRKVYKSNHYISSLNPLKRRDVHLGIDIFVKENTPIKSPLNGKVIILHNNNFKYDYGPTVILEHKINSYKFFTLYGHLSKKCLKKLKVGQMIKKGQWIGEIGNYKVNGNWSPHLHFQIMTSLLNEVDNFPGVGEEYLLNIWEQISPDPNIILQIPESFFTNIVKKEKILLKRKKNIALNLSISYQEPLHMLEAKDQFFYDEQGSKYLDCVNNISHVGHSNKLVHDALVSQNLKLNTNTRYLYNIINEYSDRLLKTFPKKLSKIFFVCTGSEANDLALRIAKNYTKAQNVLVMDNAYHGHTNSLIDLSPYKFNSKGGEGKKDYVHVLRMPDEIRGKWTKQNNKWINKYIDEAKEIINKHFNKKNSLSSFFFESILGCGGQIELPKGYLKNIVKLVRQKNALCIADEVQTGFGRVGSNFWAFEEHEIVPDIVTLGKPMGNGHPIAAVVTTKKIANTFNNGMEYFNSFGGNPVSCAVGNAVLDVIEKDNLQKNSKIVGNYFLKHLRNIQKKFPNYISKISGKGLFIGIDLIINGNFLLPNPKLATKLINSLRLKGILLSTDGPYNNVIKIKPPLVFNKDNVNFVCSEIDKFLINEYKK
ncbi:aminotransferase class III-fold pyridoxal phosphate-dependent enzyme [Pelagibacteraceae bacterium]|nr:aminotransferase class III-fold pyridoxal phosphate-dependent enzyme [Pelagibacteraceae bacterium]